MRSPIQNITSRAFFILSVLLFCISVNSYAQIVNVESARMQSDTTGWMGGAKLSMSLTQSVATIVGANAEAHLQYKTKSDKSLWLILGNYGFLKGGSVKYISNRFIHLRYNYKVTSWLRWEVFTQLLNNLITKIDTRFLVGTGPRFKIVKNNIIRLYAASLVMYEHEKDATVPITSQNAIRSSSYLSFTYTPMPSIEIISTTFYQPLFRNFKDYRILNEIDVRVKATKHYSMSIKWDYLYDQFPAGNSPKTTYSISSGVQFEF